MEGNQGQNQPKSRPSTLIAILFIAQVIFVIFLAVSIPQLFKTDEINDEDLSRVPVAEISNFSSVAPENYSGFIDGIEITLFDLILRNSPDHDVSTSIKAVVRENSVRTVYFERQNLNYLSAIVDIPDLQQSYWFYNEYSDDKPNPYIDYSKTFRIFCLDDSQEILYPDFKCQDDFDSAGRDELLVELIKYFDFTGFTTSIDTEEHIVYIALADSSASQSTQNSYIDQVRQAIDSLGISPDSFTYQITKLEDVNYESYVVEF